MLQIQFPQKGAKVVQKLSDFPVPVGNVISLPAMSDWLIQGEVDLQGNRLVCLGKCSINGISSETSFLFSIGLLTEALITTEYSLPLQNLSIIAVIGFDIQGAGTAEFNWMATNMVGVLTIGTINNASNFIVSHSAWLSSQGLTIDGTAGTTSFDDSFCTVAAGGTLLTVAATCVFTRRLRFSQCSIVVPSGAIGIDIVAGATIPNDMLILTDVGFSGGSANYVRGVTPTDNRNRWEGCRGVQNDTNFAFYYMSNNTTPTVIAAVNTYVDIAGTTTPLDLQRFAHSNNRVDYLGVLNRTYTASATASMTAGNNQTLSLRFIVRTSLGAVKFVSPDMVITTSGTGRSENIRVEYPVILNTGDYVRAQVANTNTTNIVVSDLAVLVK